ncbi:hypothetical protein, partial [Rhodoblastus sp.]
DGSYDLLTEASGSAWGQPYASYDFTYTSAGVLDQETFYSGANGTGAIVASETLQSNGSFTVDLNSLLYLQKNVNPDGSYDVWHYTAGMVGSIDYASYDVAYSSSGVATTETFYSSGGAPVYSVNLADDSDPNLQQAKLSDQDAAPANQIAPASATVDGDEDLTPAPAAAALSATRIGSLMFGAAPAPSAPAADVEKLFRGREGAEALAAALVLGAAPLTAVLARRRARKPAECGKVTIFATFDMVEDRFEPVEAESLEFDLPLAGHSDHGEVDWIAMN